MKQIIFSAAILVALTNSVNAQKYYTKNGNISFFSKTSMENIKAGTFWINDPLTDNEAAPFGGMRASGIGRELGAEGLEAFREPKHVHLDYVMEVKDYWYPYAQRPVDFDQ